MIQALNLKKPLLVIISYLAFSMVSPCALADNPSATHEKKVTLSLLEIYKLALQSDPILKAAEYHYKAQKEYVPQAIANFLPQIYAQAVDTWVDTGQRLFFQSGELIPSQYNTQSYNLNLNQPLVHMELFSELSQATQIKIQALKTLLAADQDLMIRSSERYFAVLGAQDNVYFAQGQRKAFSKQYEQAKHRFEVGLVPITDVLEAKAAYDNAVALEIAANNQLGDRYEELRELVGQIVQSIASIPLDKKLPLLPPTPKDQEAWVNTAHANNLEIQIDTAAARAAKANIQTQRAGHLPTLDLSIQSGYGKPPPPSTPEYTKSSVISLTATLPLFQGGAILSRTRQAKAIYCEALENLDHRRRIVDSETRQRYRGVLTNISETDALSQSVISNRKAVESIRAGYNAGTRTLVDILNAESTLLRVERDYALARYDYLLEGLRLKRVAGILNCQDIANVSYFLER